MDEEITILRLYMFPLPPMAAADHKRTKRRAKNQVVPEGAEFMPNVSLECLDRCHKEQRPGIEKCKLRAAQLRKRGKGIREASRIMGIAYSTIRDWLVRLHRTGPKSRFNKKPGGGRRKLSADVMATVSEWIRHDPPEYGFTEGGWQLNMIQEMLRKTMGITECKPRTLQRALGRIGCAYIKPRSVPYNSKPQDVQETFKTSFQTDAREYAREGYYIATQDETHVLRCQSPDYAWRHSDAKAQTESSYSRESVSIFGMLGKDGHHMMITDSANATEFIKFLKEILRIHPKIVLVLDNASYHKAKIVQEFVESTNGALILVWLPAYTPQLNPIETQWRVLKRLLADRYFETLDDLKEAITDLIQNNRIKAVKLHDYLLT